MRRSALSGRWPSLVSLAIVCVTTLAGAQESGHGGMFSALTVGQVVSVQQRQDLIEIDIFSPNPQNVGTHRILEVGTDFVVIEDVVGVTQSWIPATAIRRINRTTLSLGR